MSIGSRDRVRRHRAKLRQQGMKPITIWVPDTSSADFAREAHRQSVAIASHAADEDEQRWVDEASIWTDDE